MARFERKGDAKMGERQRGREGERVRKKGHVGVPAVAVLLVPLKEINLVIAQHHLGHA